MNLTPDNIVLWEGEDITLNATLVFSWLVVALLVVGSWLTTRRLSGTLSRSRTQNLLEMAVQLIREQIRGVARHRADSYLPFIGSLYLYIACANFLSFIPGYHPATGSLSTTAALATCVFFAVPIYGIRRDGVLAYLKRYLEPTALMLPFNVMGELSRTLALAVRLFGNVMSGTLIIAILLSVAPLFFPVVMRALELLIGQVQAYIFAVLAMVYIASASRTQSGTRHKEAGSRAAASGASADAPAASTDKENMHHG